MILFYNIFKVWSFFNLMIHLYYIGTITYKTIFQQLFDTRVTKAQKV